MRRNPLTSISLAVLGLLSLTGIVFLSAFFRPAAAQMGSPLVTIVPRLKGLTAPLTQVELNEFTGNVALPNGMVWFNDKIYTLCAGDSTVYELDAESGATETYIYGVRDAHTLFAERGADGEVALWIPDIKLRSLLLVTRTEVKTIAQGFSSPWGITDLNEDTFLISDFQAGTIESVTRSGQRRTLIEGLHSPTGLAHDDVNLYVANSASPYNSIEWYPLAQLNGGYYASRTLVSGLRNVTGIQMFDGYLYFAYAQNGKGVVGRVDPQQCVANGGCSVGDVELVVLTDLDAPLAGLTFSPDGRIYLHKQYQPQLYWGQLKTFTP